MYKAIQIKDYWVIVSDEEVKDKDWYYIISQNRIEQSINKYGPKNAKIDQTGINKIIAHKPIGNAPIIEGVHLFDAPWEENVERVAEEYSILLYPINGQDRETVEWIEDRKTLLQTGFKAGYQKHAEKYQFTLEDMEKAMKYAWTCGLDKKELKEHWFLQSLNKKEYSIEFEYETIADTEPFGTFLLDYGNKTQLKIIDGKVIIKSYKQL